MGAPSEFQAIVLAGGSGSRFLDVTSLKTKCLLPVGNYPMIWYSFQMLQKVGFQDVIVVTNDHAKAEVAAIPKKFGGLDNFNIEVISQPSSLANTDLGTADAIRLVYDRLKSPRIMVVSCDLVTDVQIHNLTDLHRVHDAAVTALFYKSNLDYKSIPVPGPKNKYKKEKDVVGIDMSNNQICFLSSEADLADNISLKKSVLLEHSKISLLTNLTDAHFYILDKWVCDFLMKERNIFSIKGELIPLLVKKQFTKNKRDESFRVEEESQLRETIEDSEDIFSFASALEDKMSRQAQKLSSWNDHKSDLHNAYHDRLIRCYGYITDTGINYRLNNLYTYCDLNRQISKLFATISQKNKEMPLVHPNAQIQARARIGPECLIGDASFISDKTTTKHSSIGSHCKVEEKVTISNSIIMDNVTVKEGCQLSGCLLGEGVVVPEECEIKDCIVGRGYSITKGAKHTNELLIESRDRMMEI